MIYYLHGVVQQKTPTAIVLDVNGVGYYLGTSLQTSSAVQLGETVRIYTQPIIREDAHLLFGFATLEEKDFFNLLISVNGVGPVSALIMLSSLTIPEITKAVMNKEVNILQKVKGIGAKTAERIIVDLKDKVQKYKGFEENISTFACNKVKEESLTALEILGIGRKVSEKIADNILKQNETISVEDLVKQILKKL